MAAPRQLVSAPAFTPLPYGLLSVIDYPAAGDQHWQNGITYETRCVTAMGGTTYDECIVVTGAGVTAAPRSFSGGSNNPTSPTFATQVKGATPFTAFVEFVCSTVGNEEAQRFASEAIAQSGSWQVERAFWTGTAGGQPIVYPHLAAASSLTALDGAVLQSIPVTGGSATTDIVEGLGFLEKQLADCYNGVGVIHVPVEALSTLDAWGLVKVQGQTLKTLNGNKVAVGAGYPGSSPAGAAPAQGTTWMYATGAVFGYAGTVRLGNSVESLDRSENTIKMIAQRTYVLGWDCCHAGVLVQLGVPAQ